MTLGIDWDADVAQCVADLGGTITPYGGSAVACVISTVSKSLQMPDLAGVLADISIEVVVQTSLLATRIVANDRVALSVTGGTLYRVVRVETDPADAALNLYLEEITT